MVDKIFVAGGAGFIGSHVVDQLIKYTASEVTVFDNFSSGQMQFLAQNSTNPKLTVIEGDLKDKEAVTTAIAGARKAFHFASNPDIAKAMAQPDVDFWEGTYLTQNLLEAIRVNGVAELVYASGSGVYGDTGNTAVTEDWSPMLPISPYGASKLACEAMIHAYSHMFGLRASVFRFANVVGDNQTHGVAYDFIRRLRQDPSHLRILGDGTQSKSYIHVDDVVKGLFSLSARSEPFQYFHLATEDYLTVTEIADMVVAELNLASVRYDYTGGDRGWRGDVPVVRFDLTKAHTHGWHAQRSAQQAMRASIRAMISATAE